MLGEGAEGHRSQGAGAPRESDRSISGWKDSSSSPAPGEEQEGREGAPVPREL